MKQEIVGQTRAKRQKWQINQFALFLGYRGLRWVYKGLIFLFNLNRL